MLPFKVEYEGRLLTVVATATKHNRETVFICVDTKSGCIDWMPLDQIVKCKWIGWVGESH